MVGVKAAIYGLAGFLGLLETFWGHGLAYGE